MDSDRVYYFKDPAAHAPVQADALIYKPSVFKTTIPGTTLTVNGPATGSGNGPSAIALTGLTAGEQEVDLGDLSPGTYTITEISETLVIRCLAALVSVVI